MPKAIQRTFLCGSSEFQRNFVFRENVQNNYVEEEGREGDVYRRWIVHGIIAINKV